MTTARLQKWVFLLGLVALSAGMLAPSAAALCATCYKNAAGAGTKVIEALRSGILVLLIPTLALFVGIFVFAFRRRNLDSLWEPVLPPPSQIPEGWEEQPTVPGKNAS